MSVVLDDEFETGYEKVDRYSKTITRKIASHISGIIESIGEDTHREGLIKTPERVARATQFLTHGYNIDPAAIIRSAIFTQEKSEMVIIKDIELYSLCEHHMLPFYGRAHVAYIPHKRLTGLSKIARVVDAFARRLQVQERLTCQILECVQETLQPHGVAVVIEAKHLCMMMRGVQKQNSVTTTSAFTGEFEKQPTRNEFINLISARLS